MNAWGDMAFRELVLDGARSIARDLPDDDRELDTAETHAIAAFERERGATSAIS